VLGFTVAQHGSRVSAAGGEARRVRQAGRQSFASTPFSVALGRSAAVALASSGW
jgi:hypothetical protein